MKHVSGLIAVTLAILLCGPAVFAQTAQTTTKPVVPLQLKPTSNAPIILHMVDDSKTIYQAIGKAAGLDVMYDPDYASRRIPVDLTNVNLLDALRIVGEVSGTFYKPVTSNAIFVAANTHAKHTDLDDMAVHTFYLTSTSQQSEANEEVTALRNLLPPDDKIYLIASQNAIVVRAPAEQIELAQALLNDLDRRKKTYRLTYTVSEMDGARQVSSQHFAMVMSAGQSTTLKQGSKVPVVTGSYNPVASDKAPAGAQTQVTYLDVGMNFDATLTQMGDGAMLKFAVEQSSVAPEQSGVGTQDPIVRQSSLKGTSYIMPNKSLVLGSLAIPGGTHHLEVEAVMEQLP